jgi:hypothetical protein
MYLLIPINSKSNAGKTPESTIQHTENVAEFEAFYEMHLAYLNSLQKDSIERYQKDLTSLDSANKIIRYTQLIQFAKKEKLIYLANFFVVKKAEIIQHPNSWDIAAMNLIQFSQDTSNTNDIAQASLNKAIQVLNTAKSLDPTHAREFDAKIAQIHMDFQGEPMKGVAILKEILTQDSTYIPAQMLLAKYGLISGQNEKVLERTNLIISLKPKLHDARWMRIDALMALNRPKEALSDMEYLLKNASISQELKQKLKDEIQHIKNI